MNDIPVSVISCLVMMLLFSCLAAVFFKRIKFPYTVGLVLIGLVLGVLGNRYHWLGPMKQIHLTPNIILYILLPTLVFDAAVNMDARLLIKNLRPVLILAVPGLVIATLITGVLTARWTPLGLGAAMLFGGLISATDPVAVISMFKELGAPKRLTMLVDGESLFNDATAIVAFNIILGLLTSGAALGAATLFQAGFEFLAVFVGGTLVGALVGFLMVQLLSIAREEPLIEVALTTVIAYAAFILAQFYLDLSGVMAVVGAGLVVGYYRPTRFTPTARTYIKQFWEFASFAANTYIFLLLGLTHEYLTRDATHITRVGKYVVLAILTVLIARAVVIFGIVPLMNRFGKQRPIRVPYQVLMFWGGLRGALPIGLAMSLTAAQVGGEMNRLLILDFTLGVVMFTLILQGMSIKRLMHWMRLDRLSLLDTYEKTNAELTIKRESLKELTVIESGWKLSDREMLQRAMADRQAEVEAAEKKLKPGSALPTAVRTRMLWEQAFNATGGVWSQMYEMGFIRESVLRELEHFLDLCREDVTQAIIPPRARRVPSLEERCNNALVRLFDRVAPNSATAEKVRKWKLKLDYSICLAMSEANRHTDQVLPRLAELSGADEDTLLFCQLFFRALHETASKNLQSLSTQYDSALQTLQEASIRRLGLILEMKTLGELMENRGVSEKIAQLVESELQEALSRTDAAGMRRT